MKATENKNRQNAVLRPRESDAEYVRDTQQHIDLVRLFMAQVTDELVDRAVRHDASKFMEPERSIFGANTKKRDSVAYGSQEYHDHLNQVSVALNHHYAHNRHHPEYHEDGIADMNLLDLIEMVCDWTAASMRQSNGDPAQVYRAIDINRERFGYSAELADIFKNTVTHLLRESKRGTERAAR